MDTFFKASTDYHTQSKTQQAESGCTTKPYEVQTDVILIQARNEGI